MNILKDIKDSRVLLQLSGGKDSIACLHMLKENGINCLAIHFTHKWCYSLPTSEAISKCQDMGVELKITDITKEICEVLLDNFLGRPCRYCKAVMDKLTVEYAKMIGADYICTGDSKSDKTLFDRLEKVCNKKDIYINGYFNEAVDLPGNLKILRPLAEMDNNMVFDYLDKHNIQVKRVGDTGDKYFEYSREGCPLQFKDYGVKYTYELMDDLKKLNEKCTVYALAHGIKASIHLPSRFIVTIPLGYEEEIRKFLNIEPPPSAVVPSLYSYIINIPLYDNVKNHNDIIRDMVIRFCERMCLRIIDETGTLSFILKEGFVSSGLICDNILTIYMILECERLKHDIENIIIELFHTNNFIVSNIFVRENNFE